MIRLDKFLADSGVGTRTDVKKRIREGRITVNDAVGKKPDLKVDPEQDQILFDHRPVIYEKYSYYLFHFVSSNGEAYTIHLDWGVAGTSIAIAVISIAVATYMYKGEKQSVADALARRFNGLWTAAYHRFYLDEIYQFITHRIIFGS